MKQKHIIVALVAITVVAYFYHMKKAHGQIGGMI